MTQDGEMVRMIAQEGVSHVIDMVEAVMGTWPDVDRSPPEFRQLIADVVTEMGAVLESRWQVAIGKKGD